MDHNAAHFTAASNLGWARTSQHGTRRNFCDTDQPQQTSQISTPKGPGYRNADSAIHTTGSDCGMPLFYVFGSRSSPPSVLRSYDTACMASPPPPFDFLLAAGDQFHLYQYLIHVSIKVNLPSFLFFPRACDPRLGVTLTCTTRTGLNVDDCHLYLRSGAAKNSRRVLSCAYAMLVARPRLHIIGRLISRGHALRGKEVALVGRSGQSTLNGTTSSGGECQNLDTKPIYRIVWLAILPFYRQSLCCYLPQMSPPSNKRKD